MTDSTTLAKRLSVSELVAIYEQAERDIRDGFGLVARAQKSLDTAFTLEEFRTIRVRDRYQRVDFDEPNDSIETVRRCVWSALVERLELRRFMSIAAWEELERQLRDGEAPEITHDTVMQMAE